MKNKKGFTLIELLAVIVILGLLMAIAIPSVTKYITQSRKKTVTTTIGNYISALTNQVNDMEYVFTGTNTVYAVPIECIALERGGTNPFGKWHQASNAYWAYVLVQYDDNTSSYTYGFTFKDSAGYGLYPTTSEKLNENGSQIQTGLNLTRPTGGTISNITVKDNWLGFDVDNNTSLVVLEATSEGETGNGTTTCTLCQKGDNYSEVVEAKKVCVGVGTNKGNLITCGSESFYVIYSDSTTITAITKYNVNLDVDNPAQTSSIEIDGEKDRYANDYYWIDKYIEESENSIYTEIYGIKPQYGTEYPLYVYDSNSNLYEYVEAYVAFLKELGVKSASAKLLGMAELNALGCTITADSQTCSLPSWAAAVGSYPVYATGLAVGEKEMLYVASNSFGVQSYKLWSGIRPAVTISKSQISFES